MTLSFFLLHKELIGQTIRNFLASKIRGKREHSSNNRQYELTSHEAMVCVHSNILVTIFIKPKEASLWRQN